LTFADASANRGEKLSAVFRDKPEMVIHFPEWMLPRQQIREYRGMQDLAIVEIAGRDSVAAEVLAAAQNGYSNLLPVYAYTGTEYGTWNNVEQAVCRLARRLPETRVHPLVVAGSPAFWRALNGRILNCTDRAMLDGLCLGARKRPYMTGTYPPFVLHPAKETAKPT
jgi:hypothetical protein